MRYYIISGEASGDLHGSNLIKELRKLDTQAHIRAWGGNKMQDAGATLVKHYRDLAFMGFVEVILNLKTILSNIAFCKKDILAFKPDVLVLIDYPGFNLRIARWAKKQGIKVVYYIAPQVWAWKENRAKAMKRDIDKMLVILPFEKEYFAEKWRWPVSYVGHPLVKVIDDFAAEKRSLQSTEKHVIALLPGSRSQEISVKLPIMLEVTKAFPHYSFVVSKAPGQDDAFYKGFLEQYTNVSTTRDTYELLATSDAALVTSGTATLETALFEVPQVVCYKGNSISYAIAKRLIKIKYISLVNLIVDKPVIKELIQKELKPGNLIAELDNLLHNDAYKSRIQNDYKALKHLLSAGGNASENAAKQVWACINT